MLDGYAPVASTVLGKIADSPTLKHICMRAYEQATSRPAPYPSYYQILRCLTGETSRKHSMVFHFDSYVLTLLLPIEVQAGEENGELILLPNFRPIRRWYVSNLIDKILLDNALTQWFLAEDGNAAAAAICADHADAGRPLFVLGLSIHPHQCAMRH
jgi:hypothetical protein